MLPDIGEIRRRRKALGMTQKELASLAGVSQSFVAKVESGKTNPSYQHIRKILEVLEGAEKKNPDVLASQLYHKRVISVLPGDSISKAAKLMKRRGISQLPVFSNGSLAGSLTEKAMVDAISRGAKVSRMQVADIMEEPFPQVQESASLAAVAMLLRSSPAVLVTRKGDVVGIITKADLMKTIR